MDQLLLSKENLKKARKAAGFTQEAAAEQLSISVKTLQAYEQGTIEIDGIPVAKVRAMGRLYGVSFIV